MINSGDRIEVESEVVGRATRTGKVIDKAEDRLHVRWDDGHESTFIPSAGNVKVVGEASETDPAGGGYGPGDRTP